MRWPWSRSREVELDRELRDHLDLEREELEYRGHAPSDAQRRAQLAFGNPAGVREDVRETWGGMWLERLIADVRYAVRIWVRTPGFTLIAITTLSLAIASTTVIFGQINAVFWKPLPVADPSELRLLAWTSPRAAFVAGPNVVPGPLVSGVPTYGSLSYPAYATVRDGTRAFSDLACWSDLGEARPIIIGERGFGAVQFVSGNYFRTLGVGAPVGRTIEPDDDRPGSWSPVAMISYPFWTGTFGADPNVTRQTVRLNGQTFAIVGVMPDGFFGLDPSTTPDVVIPMQAVQIAAATQDPLANRGIWNACRSVGRLAPGVSAEQARLDVERLLAESIRQQPPLAAYDPPRVWLVEASHGLATLRDGSAAPLVVLFGVVTGLSLAACANIAGLLLARGSARSRELATRLALGAPRRRVARQLITESLVLSIAGGVGGLAAAYAMSGMAPRVLSQFLPTLYGADRALSVSAAIDLRVALFAGGAAIVFGLLFGVLPAVRLTRVNLIAVIRQTAPERLQSPWRMTAGQLMVAAQTALAILLLVGAGMFLRTLANLRAGELGFSPEGLIYARVEPRTGGLRTPEQRARYFEDAVRRLERLPGVVSAAASDAPPISMPDGTGILAGSRELCAGGDRHEAVPPAVTLVNVAPRYFETLDVPLLAGRDFSRSEAGLGWLARVKEPGGAAVGQVAIVNEAFAVRYFSGDALGRAVTYGFPCGRVEATSTIVGVVRDTRHGLRASPAPTMYVPLAAGGGGPVTLMARTRGEVAALVPTIRAAIRELNPAIPTFAESEVVDLREGQLRQERLLTSLLTTFGTITLLVCCLGIYGMLSYAVVRRRGEISVRMAIGARGSDVVRMVVRESASSVLVGALAGVAVSLALTRSLQSLLFGVPMVDPLVIAAAVALFLAVATLAAAVPARAATRIDPVLALRQ